MFKFKPYSLYVLFILLFENWSYQNIVIENISTCKSNILIKSYQSYIVISVEAVVIVVGMHHDFIYSNIKRRVVAVLVSLSCNTIYFILSIPFAQSNSISKVI